MPTISRRGASFALYLGLIAFSSFAAAPDYSKEATVIQQFSRDVSFTADGLSRTVQTAVVRIQSEAGVREYGVLTFRYSPDNSVVEIAYVRVRKPDGSVVSTPPENVQDVSSEITRVAPSYSDLHEEHIPVKALGVGDTLEYQITVRDTKPEIPGRFWYSENFLTGAVVLEETLRIRTPADKYVKLLSPTLKPEVHQEPGQTVYFWKTSQLEPTSNDSKKKQATTETKPSVALTTFKSWDELGRWYGQLQAGQVTVTPAIQEKAAELTRGLTDNPSKQRAIYNYVSTKFRYISISFGIGRYQPHAASAVLDNQYGDCKDKHTLFTALLRAAGIEAYPALIGVGIKIDPEMPSPAQFNHVITAIPDGKEYVWLDSTAEVAPYGLLASPLRGEKALVIPSQAPALLVETPADPAFPSADTLDVQGTLAADGTLKAHFDMTVHGDTELLLRAAFHQVPATNWQELIQTMVNSLGFAGTVSNLDVDNPENLDKPFHYSFDYLRKEYGDWANRRIFPPFFAITLPFSADDAEKPEDAIFMNARGDITYHATLHLPKEFSAEIPDSTNLQSSFAAYSSTYTLADGVLSASRHISFKQSKVPLTAWDDYRKFAKQVNDDQTRMIQLAVSTGAPKVSVAENNPEAESLVKQALQSLQSRDVATARSLLARAERLNPKQRNLWWGYATLYFVSNEQQKGLDALEKELKNAPDNIPAYRALASAQNFYGHRAQAINTLQNLLRVAPGDHGVIVALSSLLLAEKRYKEVPGLVENALKNTPDDVSLQLVLTEAYLRDGRKDEGVAVAKKVADDSNDAYVLNSVAWFLADTNTDVSLAKTYSEKSVSLLENKSKDLSLANLSDEHLKDVHLLAASWDTLGWIYFQSGNLEAAEKYVNASWALTQGGDVGDHLGQIYEREGKRDLAIHTWRLSLAADNKLEDTRDRLRKIGGPDSYHASILSSRKTANTLATTPEEELAKLRTIPIPDLPTQEESAEFFLLFSPGKVEDAKFISGSDKLKDAAPLLLKAKYDAPFPDNGPEKIARRGILSCSTYTSPSCQIVLLNPSQTQH